MPDDTPVSNHPPALLSEFFDYQLLAAVRHAVGRLSHTAGLSGLRLDNFVLAVNELMTNSVRHAGGSGTLTLWRLGRALRCEVSDDGPGIPDERVRDHRLPPALAIGGRGLWLADRLCDTMTIMTGPAGTTVALGMALG